MTNSLALKERALQSIKQKRGYTTDSDAIKANCNMTFQSLSETKIDYTVAKKTLKALRGK